MRKTTVLKKDLQKPVVKQDLVDVVKQVITVTKKDTKDAITQAISEVKSFVKEEVEVAVAQIVSAVAKSQNDLDNKLSGRLDDLDHTVKDIKFDVSDIKRRMTDLEADTPSKNEFEELKRIVHRA